ncbi:hypothetical protein DFP72DRAFT_564204 [Ephemerocybe angulata]|uniref:Uncharacterized protein n=1 Tax=Ephemerocybe angulata TaxID=980116 RepID=A0A8H6IEE1_9AGAR|nr:hypothetical protein DFP72DRAFT_564204 [Tulosesus angulatus]
MSYYPAQGTSYGPQYGGQQAMYQNPGYVQTASYGVPASGVVYVPSSRSYSTGIYDHDDRHPRRHRSRRRSGRRSYERSYSYPSNYYSGVPVSQPGVVMTQPSAAYGYQQPGYHNGHHRWTFGQRVRLFFGLAPTPAFKYRSEKNTWGFMGYSRRQRYVDPRTGGEVDREGRPIIRV